MRKLLSQKFNQKSEIFNQNKKKNQKIYPTVNKVFEKKSGSQFFNWNFSGFLKK